MNVVISFIKRPNEPNCVVAPYSHPRRQAAEDAKAIIPIALKNDEKLCHAERKANKKIMIKRTNALMMMDQVSLEWVSG